MADHPKKEYEETTSRRGGLNFAPAAIPEKPFFERWGSLMLGSFSMLVVIGGGLIGLGQYDSRSQARWESLNRHIDVQTQTFGLRLETVGSALNDRITREIQLVQTRMEAQDRAHNLRLTEMERRQAADDSRAQDYQSQLRNLGERLSRVEGGIGTVERQNDLILRQIQGLRDALQQRPATGIPPGFRGVEPP